MGKNGLQRTVLQGRAVEGVLNKRARRPLQQGQQFHRRIGNAQFDALAGVFQQVIAFGHFQQVGRARLFDKMAEHILQHLLDPVADGGGATGTMTMYLPVRPALLGDFG